MQSQKVLFIEYFNNDTSEIIMKKTFNFNYDVLVIKKMALYSKDDNFRNFQLPYNLKKLIIFECSRVATSSKIETYLDDYINLIFKIPFGCEVVKLEYNSYFDLYEHFYYKNTKPLQYFRTFEINKLFDKNIKYESYLIKYDSVKNYKITSYPIFFKDEETKKYYIRFNNKTKCI